MNHYGDDDRTDDRISSGGFLSSGGIPRCTFTRTLVCILAGVVPLVAFYSPSRYGDDGSNPLWSTVIRRRHPSVSRVDFGYLSHTYWQRTGVLPCRADISHEA